MRRLAILMFAASVSAPALAQHSGHAMPAQTPAQSRDCPAQGAAQDPHAGHQMPSGGQAAPACPPPPQTVPAPPPAAADPHAGHNMAAPAPPPAPQPATDPHAGHVMPGAAPVPPPAAPAQPPATDPHAGHDMQAAPAAPASPPQADPHAGHTMPPPATSPPAATATDPHAGHDMPMPAEPQEQQAADPHAGHDMGAMGETAAAPPVAPPPPAALSGPAHAADLVYGSDPMAEAREELRETHGDLRNYRFLVDQLEVSFGEGREGYTWEDVQFWYGDDINKLWLKSQGEGTFGERLESAEVQALWSRAVSPWFDVQTGVRYDFRPDPQRAYLVLGVQGLAPYWFELDGALFLSNKGDLSARFEAEYDQRITQRLILQPRAELDFALQDVPEIGIGSGLSTAELGLRLRYEFFPASSPAVIAPYAGIQYERAFGDTARFRRAAGDDVGGWRLVFGVRTWF